MTTTQLNELTYEPIKVHEKKVVNEYNELVLSHEDGFLNITDDAELAAVENKLLNIFTEEPEYLEPIIDLLGIYEITKEREQYNKLLEHAYKVALHRVADRDGTWGYDVIEWAWLENRCIIRALQIGAMKCWKDGNTHEAKKVFQNLLKVNPGDNSGVRYQLLGILEGMTAKQFDNMMGDTGFVPPAIPKWFDEKAKLHPEFTELLKKWENWG